VDNIEKLLSEVLADTELDVSRRNLISTLDMVADCEYAAAEFRAESRSLLNAKLVDLVPFASEQERRGDDIFRLCHEAAHCLMEAKKRLREYREAHRVGGRDDRPL
jgi:ABC-type transporter Mla subunit MlaD